MVELTTRLRDALAGVPRPLDDSLLVFPSEAGGYRDGANFRNRVFNRLVRRALGATRHASPHVLRHTWASRHLAAGTPLKWVQARGGWTTAKMLLDVYGHFLPRESFGYADRIATPTALDGTQAAPLHEVVCMGGSIQRAKSAMCLVKDGADARTRTADLLITNQLLYQLSYVGVEPAREHCVTPYARCETRARASSRK